MDIESLKVQRRVEELLNKVVYPMLKHFPKSETFCLCREIKNSFYEVIKDLMTAANVRKDKIVYLRQTDIQLKLILVYFNVAEEQNYITKKKLNQLQSEMQQICRIVGQLIKNFK